MVSIINPKYNLYLLLSTGYFYPVLNPVKLLTTSFAPFSNYRTVQMSHKSVIRSNTKLFWECTVMG